MEVTVPFYRRCVLAGDYLHESLSLLDRNTQLQKEVASLKAYLKVAKKRLKVSGGHISKFMPFLVVPSSINCGFCNLANLISGDRSLIL